MTPRPVLVLFALFALAVLTLPAQPPIPPAAPSIDEPLLFTTEVATISASGRRGWACAITGDGKTLVTCGGTGEQRGEILVWDLAKGEVTRTIDHPVGVRSIAIMPGDKVVAAGCYDGSLRLFDLSSGELKAVGTGHTSGVNGVAVTADGTRLVTAGLDKHVKVWLVTVMPFAGAKPIEMKPFASLEEHTSRVFCVAVTRDGKTIVSGGEDNAARLWTMPEPATDGTLITVKKSRRALTTHSRAIETVAISPDDRTLITGSWDNTTRVWNLETGQSTNAFGNSYGVQAAAFSPDGQMCVTGSGVSGTNNPGELRLFDMPGGGGGTPVPLPLTIRGVCFTPDGKSIVAITEDRSVVVRGLGDDAEQRTLKPPSAAADAPQLILALAWSPNAKSVAYAGENRSITVFDTTTKQSRSWTAHADVVSTLAFSPNGTTLASASHDGSVKVWHVGAWQPGFEAPPVRVLVGHQNWVFALAFNADGSRLVSGSYDKTVRIWDAETTARLGHAMTVIDGKETYSAGVRAVAFAPGGKEIISTGADRTIRFWDAVTGKPRGFARGHKGAIRALALAPDGRTLATGSEDRTVKLWDIQRDGSGEWTAKERRELTGHQDMVGSLAFSPGGRTLAAGTWNGMIHLWDPHTGRQRTVTRNFTGAVSAVAFSSDGQKLAAGSYDRNVRVWSGATNAPTPAVSYMGHDQAVTAVALSPDGQWSATGDLSGALRFFERGGKLQDIQRGVHPGGVTGMAASPDGKRLVSVGRDGYIRLWEVLSGKQISGGKAHEGEAHSVVWSPDGKLIASAGQDRVIIVRDGATGIVIKKLTGHTGAVRALAFSPDSATLASAGSDRTWQLWDAKTWALRHQSVAGPNNGEFYALAFSPDGATLALAHNQEQVITPDGQLEQQQFRQVMLVNATNGQVRLDKQGFFGHTDYVTAVGFSPDGQSLITASRDMLIRFWSMADNRVLRQVSAHRAAINALAFDAQSGQMLSGGDDRAASLWSAQARRELPRATIAGQTGQVWFAELSKDGTRLATGGDDKIVRIRKNLTASRPFDFAPPFGACFSIATSPDGKLIATGHGDGQINLWDAANGKKIKVLQNQGEIIWSLAFTSDGARLLAASGSWDKRGEQGGEVTLFDVAKGSVADGFKGHAGAVYAAALSPDGKTLATGSHDGTIRLYDFASGKPHSVLVGKPVRTLAFLSNAIIVAGSHEDSTLVFVDVAARKEKSRTSIPNKSAHINRIRVSPDGKTLALVTSAERAAGPVIAAPPTVVAEGDEVVGAAVAVDAPVAPPRPVTSEQVGRLLLWDVATNKVMAQSGDTNRMLDAAFSPDGSMVASVGGIYAQVGEIKLWRASDMKLMGELHGHPRWLEAVAFIKDGRLVSGGGINQPAPMQQQLTPTPVAVAAPTMRAPRTRMEPGELRIWDVTGFVPEFELTGHTSHVACAAWHPDGSMLATGGGDKQVILWNLDNMSAEKRVLKHEDQVRAVRYSPDGKLLAVSDESGRVTLWDHTTGQKIRSIAAHPLPAYNLAFSADGKMLASCAGDWRAKSHGEVKFWDVATGKLAGELERQPSQAWSAAFHPTSDLIAVALGDGQIRVYEVATKKLARTIRTGSATRNLSFSPDGSLLVCAQNADNDPMVRLYETKTWQERATYQGHGAMVFTARFSNDGKTIISAGKDATVKMWAVK